MTTEQQFPARLPAASMAVTDSCRIGIWIPAIVAQLDKARALLPWDNQGPWQRPAGIGLGTTGPMPEHLALQETTLDVLRRTGRQLERGGEALFEAARYIGLADEEVSGGFSAMVDRILASHEQF
ncbi:hypothetical protein [Nocardioides limicola]|uniref:hypothetical protein n=1 Tax=Nocardioides limicola TaxID=2803368 RepID=UPI00193AFE42|nr:hypothetical protein [Nocardioides sp. DJM-14]